MIEDKSDLISTKHKEDGNKKFLKGNFFNALISYNKSICFAQSNENLALGYANRSAVYLELKKFDECLHNINLAFEFGYPADRVEKLKERKEKCLKLQSEMVEDPENNINIFNKLSHPPNPKIPFIADCLELRKTRIGFGIFTTRDLNPGDIIAIEEPTLAMMNQAGQYTRCCNCLGTSMLNLMPCLKSASLMFCSEDCREKIYRKLPKLQIAIGVDDERIVNCDKLLCDAEEAFGGRDEFLKFLKENDLKKMKKTVFDYDWSNKDDPEWKRNLYECIFSFNGDFNFDKIVIKPSPELIGNNRLLLSAVNHLSHVYCKLGMVHESFDTIPAGAPIKEGQMLYAFTNLYKHSCVSNVRTFHGANSLNSYVMEPVKAGEELTHNFLGRYGMELPPRLIRQQFIKFSRGYVCNCFYCSKDINWNKLKMGFDPHIDMLFNMVVQGSRELDFSSWKKTIEQLKVNWGLIEVYSKNHPKHLSKNVLILSNECQRILQNVSNLFIYPCLRERHLMK